MRRGLIAALAFVAGGVAHPGIARAFFTSTGQGLGIASESTLTAPGNPSAVVSGSNVTITWSASDVNGSSPAGTYDVERLDPSGNDLGEASCGQIAAGSGSPNANGSFSCTDSPGPGSFQYVITAEYGQSWTTASAATATATVTTGTALAFAAPASSPPGSAIAASSLSATLTHAVSGAGGTITYTVFGPQASAPKTCTSGGSAVGTASVTGNGTYNPSAGFNPSGPGTYYWYASYSGDSHDIASATTCGSGMTSTLVKNVTTTSLSVASSATAGTKVIPTATLSGAGSSATGTISFREFGPQSSPPTTCSSGGKSAGSATVTGNATYTPTGYTPTAVGTYYWYASYAPGSGDTSDAASTSACGAGMGSTTVTAATPTMTASGPSGDTTAEAIAASSITVGFTTASGSATGTITVSVFGPYASATPPTTCTSGGTQVGTASATNATSYHPSAGYTPIAPGYYYYYASYSGDANDNASTSPCGGSSMKATQVVDASPKLAMSAPGTAVPGGAIAPGSLTATLSASNAYTTATGTITDTVFGPQATAPSPCTSGGTTVGTSTVSGNGAYNPSAGFTPSAVGDYWWYASYPGDSADNAAVSTCSSAMAETTAWSATAAATGQAATGTTVQTQSFTVSPSTTYLVLVARDGGASDSLKSITGSGFSPALAFTAIVPQAYDTNDDEWSYRFTSSSSATGTGTLTATFANALGSNESSLIAVIALGGNNASTPVVTANEGLANGSSTTATAALPNAPSSAQDASIVLLAGDGDLGAGNEPTASGLTPVTTAGGAPAYVDSSAGSLAVYLGVPAQTSSTFTSFPSQGWGTIDLELKHG